MGGCGCRCSHTAGYEEDIGHSSRSSQREVGGYRLRPAVSGGTIGAIGAKLFLEGATAGGFTEGDFRKALEAQTPLGRIGQPDDIAPAAVFFASDDSKWVTGETLLIAGGLR